LPDKSHIQTQASSLRPKQSTKCNTAPAVMVQLMDKGSPAIILRGQCSYNQSIQIQTNIAIRQYKLAIARKHHLCLRCYATPPWLTKHQARERKFSALWEASSRPVMGPRWVSFYSAYACSLLTKQINIEHSHAYTLPESSFFSPLVSFLHVAIHG
jgi:hypothetical protein